MAPLESPTKSSNRLFIFDFDDTLARTNSKIHGFNPTTGRFTMTPAQYATYKPKPDDQFDYSEFDELVDPTELPKYVAKLKSSIRSGDDVAIVTARGSEKPVAQFLKNIGITSGVKIAPVGSSDPKRKTNYIEHKLSHGHYTDVVMYDDALKNIDAFQSLQKNHPRIRFHGHHVPHYHTTPTKTRQHHGPELDKLMMQTIKNPETDNDILVKTALNYEKSHPVYKLAKLMIRQWTKK